MENRDFKGIWIPKEVYLDSRLNALDKIILVEVDSLDNGDTGCFASNKYLADFCQCSQTKVSNSISKLVEYGYLEQAGFDGRNRILKSRLTKIDNQPYKNCKADLQNLRHNNIYNNINNNINNNIVDEPQKPAPKRERFIPPTIEEVEAYCKERNNNVDAIKFVNYYEANGWKVGKNKMKNWKASVRTWERNNYDKPTTNKRQAIINAEDDDLAGIL